MAATKRAVRAPRTKQKTTAPARSPNELRKIVLHYFYDRYRNATSARGKRGAGVQIKNIRSELKASHGLKQQEVVSTLHYLNSQGWIEVDEVEKPVRLPSGVVRSQQSIFYKISASGVDKIEGENEFTMDKFRGIRIEATGQNIITLGDGNVVNATFGELGRALLDLRNAITNSETSDAEKMDYVADIDTMQSQLTKPQPSKGILAAAWETVKAAATINGVSGFVDRAAALIGPLIS